MSKKNTKATEERATESDPISLQKMTHQKLTTQLQNDVKLMEIDVNATADHIDLRTSKCQFLNIQKAFAINSDFDVMRAFIKDLPKAELHLHIEGTFEPELILTIAKRKALTSDPKWRTDFQYEDDDEAWCRRLRPVGRRWR